MMRDCMFDESDKEVHMFWEAASYETQRAPGADHLRHHLARVLQGAQVPIFPKTRRHHPHARPDHAAGARRGGRLRRDRQPGRQRRPGSGVRDMFTVLDVGAPLEWTPATATHTYLDRVTGQASIAPPTRT